MSRNYRTAREIRRTADLANWADSRVTHLAVAAAIHAIADSSRSAEAIWEDPTAAESDHVEMAVAEYLANGDFEPEADDRYSWGIEKITVLV